MWFVRFEYDAGRHRPITIRFRSAKSQNRRSRGRPIRSRCSLAVRRGLRVLANGHELRAYLMFLADLCDVQHRLQPGLPDAELPPPDAIARSRQFGCRRWTVSVSSAMVRWTRCGKGCWRWLAAVAMPDKARIALDALRAADPVVEATLIGAVLANEIPPEALAEHVLWPPRLQVHFARLAAQLDAEALVPVGKALVPLCGAPPVSTLVVGWSGRARDPLLRLLAVRRRSGIIHASNARCAARPKDIAYQEIAGGPARVKAETCESCQRLRQDTASAQECFARSGRRRRRDACARPACCARPDTGAAPSIRSCSVIEKASMTADSGSPPRARCPRSMMSSRRMRRLWLSRNLAGQPRS